MSKMKDTKKYIRSIRKILLILMILFPLLGLTSCGTQHTHSYDFSKSNSTKHWKECSCGEKAEEEEHNFGDWKTTIEATEESTGTQERKCSTCDYVEDKTIAKLTHTHEYGQWEVSLEPTKDKIGTLSRVCSKNSTHIENHQLPALNKINYTFSIANATCLKAGKETYTYSIDKQEFTFTVSLNALGHTYSNEWDSDEENHWHNAICEHTTEKNDFEEHNYEDYICKTCKYEYYSKGLEFDLNSDGISYSVSSIGTATDLEIVIPRSYNNLPVTSIKEKAFENCTKITNIIIGSNIEAIGRNAFYNCSNLSVINLPDSVIRIEELAFAECSSLHSIKIPATIETIDSTAFQNCEVITNAVIPEMVISLISKSNLESVEIISGENIKDYAFKDCSKLTNVIIFKDIISMGYGCFSGCSSLESLTIPFAGSDRDGKISGEFKYIFGQAQYENSYEVDCYIPETSSHIKYYLPNNLQKVTLTNTNALYEHAFSSCSKITEIILPNNLRYIYKSAFYGCSGLKGIDIPESVTYIDEYVFSYCQNIEYLSLTGHPTIKPLAASSSYWRIKKAIVAGEFLGNFGSLGSVEEIIITDGVRIPNYMFQNNQRLKSVILPDSLETIGHNAFSGCTNLESIIIPDNVLAISQSCFSGCTYFESVVLSENIKYIYDNAFSSCGRLKNVFYKGTKDEWEKIKVYDGNSCLTLSRIYYYSETQQTSPGYYWHYVNGIPTKW
ncbi:MAG: leucine-rich repeat domain-containing protein [Anaeroplasmataceae bacterium]|nr:leucine-rich repeat domain-containing protein [Anaeroplasmataceae bacterium]